MAYKYRETEKRKEIFESAIDKIGNLISSPSDSQAIDQSVKLGRKYVERMRDAKKEYQKLGNEIRELEERRKEIKNKWETEEIRFEDV